MSDPSPHGPPAAAPVPGTVGVVFPAVGDNRLLVGPPWPAAPQFAPYAAIGRLNVTFPVIGAGWGTATVFGQEGQYLLTAAHNFVAKDPAGYVRTATSVTFTLPGGAPIPIPAGRWRLVYPAEYSNANNVPPWAGVLQNMTPYVWDLAVARLNSAVPPSPFAVAELAPNQLDGTVAWPVVPGPPVLPPPIPVGGGPPPNAFVWPAQVSGYPGDKPAPPPGTGLWTAGGAAGAMTLDPGQDFIRYQIATFGGQSGGPVWGTRPGQPYPTQIGVHIAGDLPTWNTNIAVWLTNQRIHDIMNAIDELG